MEDDPLVSRSSISDDSGSAELPAQAQPLTSVHQQPLQVLLTSPDTSNPERSWQQPVHKCTLGEAGLMACIVSWLQWPCSISEQACIPFAEPFLSLRQSRIETLDRLGTDVCQTKHPPSGQVSEGAGEACSCPSTSPGWLLLLPGCLSQLACAPLHQSCVSPAPLCPTSVYTRQLHTASVHTASADSASKAVI